MLLQQKRNNRFLLLLIFSIIFHFLLFNLFKINLDFNSEKKIISENMVEIDLRNLNFSQKENYYNTSIPEPVVNKPKFAEKVPDFKKVLNLENIPVEKVPDISSLTEIPEDIPLKYPSIKKKISKITAKQGASNRIKTSKKSKHIKKGNSNSKELIIAYLSKVTEIIKNNTIYPFIARKRELEGKVLVEVKLLKNGKIEKIKILKSSGYKILDKSAIKSIKRSEPFPPFPDNLNEPFLILRIPVEFKLEYSD